MLIYVFSQRGREGKREGEKHRSEKHRSKKHQSIASCVRKHAQPDQGPNHILGMCPDWELNPGPFSLQDNAPTNWATLARADLCLFLNWVIFLSLRYKSSLYILDTSFLADYMICKYLYSVDCLFTVLMSFDKQKFLILLKSNLPIFSSLVPLEL